MTTTNNNNVRDSNTAGLTYPPLVVQFLADPVIWLDKDASLSWIQKYIHLCPIRLQNHCFSECSFLNDSKWTRVQSRSKYSVNIPDAKNKIWLCFSDKTLHLLNVNFSGTEKKRALFLVWPPCIVESLSWVWKDFWERKTLSQPKRNKTWKSSTFEWHVDFIMH